MKTTYHSKFTSAFKALMLHAPEMAENSQVALGATLAAAMTVSTVYAAPFDTGTGLAPTGRYTYLPDTQAAWAMISVPCMSA